MDETKLIEQVFKIINSNYSNIYVLDINSDIVYTFVFDKDNVLKIDKTITFTDFIDVATKFVHKNELSKYFDSISLNKLESEAVKGNNETKFKYRKLTETGVYRWYVNIINYLPFEGKKLIFMMSEDVNDRLTDSELETIKLENEVDSYKNRINKESESISDAIYQINSLLESDSNVFGSKNTKEYINSIFNQATIDHPELNKALTSRIIDATNYARPSILIVDDSSIIRNSLKRIFQDEYNILIAKDGNEAIDIITKNVLNSPNTEKKENIVGILLDLIMPGSDGFTVLDFMKNFNLFNKLPVAIISGDETKETRKKVYQYDIVDMLEKPFNTDNIKRRIGKIINLYMSSNNLQSIVSKQSVELSNAEEQKNMESIKEIINNIVNNIVNNNDSLKLKKMARIVSLNLSNKYPKYSLDSKYIDGIVNGCSLYNIGAIAMDNNIVVTTNSIKREIDYGLNIINEYVVDEYEKKIAINIVKYSCEMYNGSGYPEGLVGDNIPIEAQITNLLVRLNQFSKTKNIQTAIKNIIDNDSHKYNPDLLDVLNDSKKELKDL